MSEDDVPAGWYADPDDDGLSQRYWDGDAWTERTRSARRPTPGPRRSTTTILVTASQTPSDVALVATVLEEPGLSPQEPPGTPSSPAVAGDPPPGLTSGDNEAPAQPSSGAVLEPVPAPAEPERPPQTEQPVAATAAPAGLAQAVSPPSPRSVVVRGGRRRLVVRVKRLRGTPAPWTSAVRGALRRRTPEVVENLRQVEQDRLDRLLEAVWPQAMTGDVPSAMTALKIIEARLRLLGLDAPEAEQTAHGTGPVVLSPAELNGVLQGQDSRR